MNCLFPTLARLSVPAVLLITLMPHTAAASERNCHESRVLHRLFHGPALQRAADHGLVHYPNATYWRSGDTNEPSGEDAVPASPGTRIAPSPWAYHSIAPLGSQYHHFYGSSYGQGETPDCRN
jgi:hypothetical protein